MANSRNQLKMIKKWIKNEGDDTKLPKRFKICHTKWGKLLNTKKIRDEIEGRIEVAKKRSQLLMVKYLPLATAKLIELCNSENNETSRKACVDILTVHKDNKPIEIIKEPEPKLDFDNETASKVWAIIAESRSRKKS
ncbi:MAG: hypothetical protein ABFD79_04475 [Phycisphaerales bacterium]